MVGSQRPFSLPLPLSLRFQTYLHAEARRGEGFCARPTGNSHNPWGIRHSPKSRPKVPLAGNFSPTELRAIMPTLSVQCFLLHLRGSFLFFRSVGTSVIRPGNVPAGSIALSVLCASSVLGCISPSTTAVHCNCREDASDTGGGASLWQACGAAVCLIIHVMYSGIKAQTTITPRS